MNKLGFLRSLQRATPSRRIIACGSIVAIAIVVAATFTILTKLRESTLNSVENDLSRRSLALAAQANLSFQSLSLVLTNISDRVKTGDIADSHQFKDVMGGFDTHRWLKEKIVGLPQIENVALVDLDGRIVNASRRWPAAEITVSDREFFKALTHDAALKMFVSEPIQSRGTGTWNIVVARRLHGLNDEFVGLVAGMVNLEFFENHWRSILDVREVGSSISLNRLDGTVLARFPRTTAIGKRFENGVQNLLRDTSTVTLRKLGPIDGAMRIEAAHVLADFPLFMLATETEETALQGWAATARIVTLVSACCVIVVLIAAYGMLRWWAEHEHRERMQAEKLEAEKAALTAEAELKLGRESKIQAMRLNAAIENMSQGLLMFDSEERIVVVNSEYIRMYGLSPDIVKPGCTLLELFQHRGAAGQLTRDPAQYRAEVLASVATGKTVKSVVETADGRQISIVNRQIADGGWVVTHEDITAQSHYEETLRNALADAQRAELRLDAAINNMSHGLVMCDAQERVVVVNDQYIQMYGLSRDIAKPGCTFRELLKHRVETGHLPNDPEKYCTEVLARLASEKTFDMNVETADGRHIAIINRPMDGGGWVTTHQDVTERNLAERKLEETRRFLNTVIENAPVAIIVKDAATKQFALVNRAYEQLIGRPRTELIGKTAYDIFPAHAAKRITEGDKNAIQTGNQRIKGEMVLEMPGTARRITATTSLVVRDNDNKPQFLIVVIEDVTERREADARIAHMAHHDALTDLPNRILLHERLNEALARIQDGQSLAVLYLDLDHFKSVNDTLGHQIGNELLKIVAERLRHCIGDMGTVARLGGDEFLIVLNKISKPEDAATFAQLVRETITAPVNLDGNQIFTDVSIGISIAPGDATASIQMLKNADMALYEAKADGRGTFRFFEPEMGTRMDVRRALELDLRKALAEGELELHYQPLVNLDRDEITGYEALLRWKHPVRGSILPSEFIPIAEETGLINAIGEWVIKTACTEAATWPSELRVAVNVSPVQFKNQTLALAVVNGLVASGLPPYRLEIEITEAVLMQDNETTLAALHQLHELGVRIAMDDFGTGYSSLSYLRSFPFDKIKIDRSFIKDLSEKDDSVAIVRAVTSLAKSLHMTTTAEGIETEGQLEWVRALGCTEVQGYLFGYPKPAAEIAHFNSRSTFAVARASSAA
ncbi:MAG: bifunctional diguanylate cyclase/phosphodiesterase [Xanthobacteraceae bacterium]